jgi:TetR/AcrR family transcriptional regulator, mexJK operon transcriptional repressor
VTVDERPPRYPAKRAAIASAALRLFVRDGYERTSVDAIAAEAAVSKRTVYSHYADKQQLFLSVVDDTFDTLMAGVQDLARQHLDGPGDLEHRLRGFISVVSRQTGRSAERIALIRLILTEAPHFPALAARWQARRGTTQSLTSMLTAALAAADEDDLDLADPGRAAEHLSALTFGQVNNRSLFGLIRMSDEQLDEIIDSGVAVFLRAYRA